MTDPGYQFVVYRGTHPSGAAPNGFPKAIKCGSGLCGGGVVIGEQAGSIVEKLSGGGGKPVALRTRHRMTADEIGFTT